MTRWRKPREEEFTEFGDVEFKGPVSASGKAILCRFRDGRERWVPFSQMEEGQSPQPGEKGTLAVTQWLVDQWADEDTSGKGADTSREVVSIPDVVALRETERGLQVRAGDKEVWLAKSQIPESSEVRFDGDRGTLQLPRWVAEDKGLVGAADKPARVSDDIDPRQQPMPWGTPDGGDDDIPF
jgi:hypothetical protein